MREPDFTGAGQWKAWKCKLAPVGQRGRPDFDAEVAIWLVFAPGAHACWSYWWISMIHLRPIPGVQAATINTPGAGYEVICMAQDPKHVPDPDEPAGTNRMLTPIDWVVQFGHAKSDEKAIEVGEANIRSIMTGQVSPDSDFRSWWKKTIPATAECYAKGIHSPS